ncbi:hypothetical protein Z945_878 [Sulfitobacter noctilucae]|nr:hypothetical protein Z945_878 [Sulfitobacter noctilucae]
MLLELIEQIFEAIRYTLFKSLIKHPLQILVDGPLTLVFSTICHNFDLWLAATA